MINIIINIVKKCNNWLSIKTGWVCIFEDRKNKKRECEVHSLLSTSSLRLEGKFCSNFKITLRGIKTINSHPRFFINHITGTKGTN